MAKILECSSDKAVTIFSSIKVMREHPTQPLTSVDLENYISQAAWKFFDKCRSEAATRLNVGEMDLALSDVRILGVKTDGHQVINPSGFTGRELEIRLSVSVVKKDSLSESSCLVEGGSMRAYILSRILELNRAFYVESDNLRTTIFSINKDEVKYFSSFDWGSGQVIDIFGEILDFPQDLSDRIYRKYAHGDVSSKFARKMDKIFYNNFASFVNGTLMNVRNAGGMKTNEMPSIYFNPFFPVPAGVYRKQFPFGARKVKFIESDSDLNIDNFLNDNLHGVYEELNGLAERRIKWLMPTS